LVSRYTLNGGLTGLGTKAYFLGRRRPILIDPRDAVLPPTDARGRWSPV